MNECKMSLFQTPLPRKGTPRGKQERKGKKCTKCTKCSTPTASHTRARTLYMKILI
ncbi:hypothetical protein Bache_2953 [Bacteroides helcogenes P 36-108]|uniref:Uncharacterized protein n=1 Tax=Bacteroides helcogenes (strain ATCC 35417 / DSM 20613 / JCM 6297 / CCUG 15421 / P 36-108) TaxID=693979 RepID=E6SPD1_BACT6|nr:hypothetical protein Bache_2953 [Bacteroides helcogenes P 36-108]